MTIPTTSTDQGGLHVALVSTQMRWHGGESQAELLASGLRQCGHRCTVLASHNGEFAHRMRQRDFEVFTFPRHARSPLAVWKLRSALRQLRPDVVHANDSHALTAVGFAGLGLKVPIRVAARRVDFALKWVIHYRAFADGLLCVSTAVKQVCLDSGVPDRLLHVVHDGAKPEFAGSGRRERGRMSLELSNQQRLLLTVAKLTDHKGHAYLLRAMPALLARFPKIVLALAGDGELSHTLQALTEELDLTRHVRFLGYRYDIPDLLAAADVIVQPSHMEGLCSSLIDAMLAARPIVATTAGGIPDLLNEQVDGNAVAWLVPPRCPADLATAIGEVLENTTAADARAQLARQRALERFTATAMVHKTLTAYEHIARQRHGDHAAAFLARVRSLAAPKSVTRSAA